MILIRGAEIYDPAHGIDGEVRDLWLDNGRIIAPPQEGAEPQVIDGRGMIVAPAGVEIHAHVAGYGLNAARRFLLPDAAALDLLTPPAKEAAERYLCLGYTTVFDAASSPLFARSTLADLESMQVLDRGTYTLMGDHLLLLKALAAGDRGNIRDTLSWLLQVSGGYAVKLVNPGGGIAWKANRPTPGLDESIGLGDLTQRKIIRMVVELVNEMGLPHPVHLHAGQLGRPGNSASFCETVRVLDGQRAHLCHIQFYAYGDDDGCGYSSAAGQVVRCIEPYHQLTFDVGQVLFGTALAVTADTSAASHLRNATGQPWISRQVEGEGGNSVLPLAYLAKSPASAVQWATGLELLLRFPDPARMFLTTDHPNGGPFTAYPQVIAWLMSSAARREALKQVHRAATKKTGLAAVKREYTLGEIFAMTSWGPARALGLSDRGHLGVGARADIRCYRRQADIQAMFSQPAWVMKGGKIVVREGRIVQLGEGDILVVRPAWDFERLPLIQRNLSKIVTVQPEHYALGLGPIAGMLEVPCRSKVS
ncbi:MAG: formylmethanofuran dehydrogenase subunit A [Chloroflexi bacterium]|nr:formylmethanofuran dehydrogenase subunit A [Chloroflexota bacterium]